MQPITLATWHTEYFQLELKEDHSLTLLAKGTLQQIPILSVSGLPERGIHAFATHSYLQVRQTREGAGLTFLARGRGGMPPKTETPLPPCLQPYAHLLDLKKPATVSDFTTAAATIHSQGNWNHALQLIDLGLTRFPNDFELLKVAIPYAEHVKVSAINYFKQILTHATNPHLLPFLKTTQLLTTYSPLPLAPLFEEVLSSAVCFKTLSINPDGTCVAIYQSEKEIILCNLTNQTDVKVFPLGIDSYRYHNTLIGSSNLLLGVNYMHELEIASIKNNITGLLYCCDMQQSPFKISQNRMRYPFPLPANQLHNVTAAFRHPHATCIFYPQQLYLQDLEGDVTTFLSDFAFLNNGTGVEENNWGNNKTYLLSRAATIKPGRFLVDVTAGNINVCTASFSPAALGCGLMIEENEIQQCYLGIATNQDSLDVVVAYYNLLLQAKDPEALTALCGMLKYHAFQNVKPYLADYCTQFGKLPDLLTKRLEGGSTLDAKLKTKLQLLKQEIIDLPLRRETSRDRENLLTFEKEIERRATKLISKLLQQSATTEILQLTQLLRANRKGHEIGTHEDHEFEALFRMKNIQGHQERLLFLLYGFIEQKALNLTQAIQKLETAQALQLPFTLVKQFPETEHFIPLIDDQFNEHLFWHHADGFDLYRVGKRTAVFSFSSPIQDCVALIPSTLFCILADGTLHIGEPHQVTKQKVSLHPLAAPKRWSLCPLSSSLVALFCVAEQTIHLYDCLKQTFLSPIACTAQIDHVVKIDRSRLAVLLRGNQPRIINVHSRQETPFFTNCANGLIPLSKNHIFIHCEHGPINACVHDINTDQTVISWNDNRVFDEIGKIDSRHLAIAFKNMPLNIYQNSHVAPVQSFRRLDRWPEWCGRQAAVFSQKQFFLYDKSLCFIMKEWKPEQLVLLNALHDLYIRNQQMTEANALVDDLIHAYITSHAWLNLLNLMVRYGNQLSQRKLLVLLLAQKKLGLDKETTLTLVKLSKKDPMNTAYYDLALTHFRETMQKQQKEILAFRQVMQLIQPTLQSNQNLLLTLAQLPPKTPSQPSSSSSQSRQQKTADEVVQELIDTLRMAKDNPDLYSKAAEDFYNANLPLFDANRVIDAVGQVINDPAAMKAFCDHLIVRQVNNKFDRNEFDLVPVPGDGNCMLWSIVVSQEGQKNYDKDELKKQQVALRDLMVNHFRTLIQVPKERELFTTYLYESGPHFDEIVGNTRGNPCVTDAMIDAYIVKLSRNGEWNDAYEVKLVADCLQQTVIVFSERLNNAPILAGIPYIQSRKPILFIQHGFNHYDALIRRV